MKTTTNLVDGELMIIERQMKLYGFITRMYSKQSYDRNFILAIGRAMTRNHITKNVKTSETDEDYILRVRD